MALEKGTKEWNMFGEYFKLCKKYWDVESNEEYWNNLASDINTFIENYKEIPLARKIAIDFMENQEKILKLKNRKEKRYE